MSRLPLLAICGGSEKGRVTFAERVLSGLREKGFDAIRILHEEPALELSAERLQHSIMSHDAVLVLCEDTQPSYSMVLLEGQAPVTMQLSRQEHISSMNVQDHAPKAVIDELVSWFTEKWLAMPIAGCVLVGGKSSRMGTAKHLIRYKGETWVERAVQTLGDHVDYVVISGEGDLPASLLSLDRVEDAKGLAGPIAGILGVMRRYPMASFLVAACDLPDMNGQALEWILSHRKPGVRGILPDLEGTGRVEPLLAYYDFRCRNALEAMVLDGSMRINRVRNAQGVVRPQPPASLRGCWRNVNTLKELAKIKRG